MSYQKIEIPKEPKPEEENSPQSLSELMKNLSITEEKKMVPLDKFKWTVDLFTNSAFYIALKIQDYKELTSNDWHFIPYEIPEEERTPDQTKKQWMQFFCIDEPKTLKRYTKTIRKYFPGVSVKWEAFDANKYKEALKEAKK